MPIGQNTLPVETSPSQTQQEENKGQPSTQIDDSERIQKLKALGFGAPVGSKSEDFEQLDKN